MKENQEQRMNKSRGHHHRYRHHPSSVCSLHGHASIVWLCFINVNSDPKNKLKDMATFPPPPRPILVKRKDDKHEASQTDRVLLLIFDGLSSGQKNKWNN